MCAKIILLQDYNLAIAIGGERLDKILIYMDNCCFNRPFDDLSYDKVRLESEAVLTIINKCEQGVWDFCSSDVIFDEIDRTDDIVRKDKVLTLYNMATVSIELNDEIIARAKEIMKVNIKPFDALNIACAESANVTVFLTTDRKLINASRRMNLNVKVSNPVVWIMEVLYGD